MIHVTTSFFFSHLKALGFAYLFLCYCLGVPPINDEAGFPLSVRCCSPLLSLPAFLLLDG